MTPSGRRPSAIVAVTRLEPGSMREKDLPFGAEAPPKCLKQAVAMRGIGAP